MGHRFAFIDFSRLVIIITFFTVKERDVEVNFMIELLNLGSDSGFIFLVYPCLDEADAVYFPINLHQGGTGIVCLPHQFLE